MTTEYDQPAGSAADASRQITRRSLVQTTGAFAVAPILLGAMPAAANAQQSTPGTEATPAKTPVPGGRLRIGLQGDPTELDPALSNLNAVAVVVDFVYEGLVHEAPDLSPQPALAESWKISDDLLTYTFKLRHGVTFHNGREFVADDVKYSFERIQNPKTASPWQTFLSGVKSIAAPDPATVVIVLSAPDASFLARLCTRGLVIVPKEEVEKTGDLTQKMVGTGPFKFKEYIPSSSLALDKNDTYWDTGKPYLDGLDLTIIPDDTQRSTALISKTVDFAEQVGQKDISLIKKDASLALVGGPTTNLRWVVFNLRREPFNQLEFRQAVFAAIDRQPIIDAAVFGYGQPLVGLYPATYWAGYHGEIPATDLAKAKELLAKVKMPDGFKPKLLTWSAYKFLSDTSVVVQEQLKQVGIESEIDPQENAIYLEQYFGGKFDIAVMGAAGYVDPNDWMQQSLTSGAENNAAGYASGEFDKLVQQGLETSGQKDRAAIYQQAQELLIKDLPWISLYNSESYVGLASKVQGFVFYLSASYYSLRETWIEG